MNGYLLDTHVLLWCLDDPELLSEPARSAIIEPDNRAIVSVASVWEIAIKTALGKLEAPDDLEDMIEDAGFELMSIIPFAARNATIPPPMARNRMEVGCH